MRKLKSFCASLGGTGQILASYDDFRRQLELQPIKNPQHIILYDTQLKLSPQQIETLRNSGRFIVIDPSHQSQLITREKAATWENDHYCSVPIETFFESAVIRVALSKYILENKPFHLNHLMRWGHTSQVWLPQSGQSMADLGQRFTRSLKLNGESRRLIEMANHLMVTSTPHFNLLLHSLTFASDGIITGIIAHLGIENQMIPPSLIEAMTMMEFPISLIIRTTETSFELGAMVVHNQIQSTADQRLFLSLSLLTHLQEHNQLSPMNKAG